MLTIYDNIYIIKYRYMFIHIYVNKYIIKCVEVVMSYEEMYNKLFSKVSDVIGELKLVQQQTEEMFICGVDEDADVNGERKADNVAN